MKILLSTLSLLLLSIGGFSQSEIISPDSKQEIFKVVEEMPRFPGCEDIEGNNEAKRKCGNDKLKEFISTRLEYPKEAEKKGIVGKVIVQFVISKAGKMEDLRLVRDLASGCGDAAMDVMKKMQREITWIPGKQRGKIVKVMFTLPIDFKL